MDINLKYIHIDMSYALSKDITNCVLESYNSYFTGKYLKSLKTQEHFSVYY